MKAEVNGQRNRSRLKEMDATERYQADQTDRTERCGVVGSTLAFGSIGHGFESKHRLFSHHGASAFSKLRTLAKCSLDDSVRRLL